MGGENGRGERGVREVQSGVRFCRKVMGGVLGLGLMGLAIYQPAVVLASQSVAPGSAIAQAALPGNLPRALANHILRMGRQTWGLPAQGIRISQARRIQRTPDDFHCPTPLPGQAPYQCGNIPVLSGWEVTIQRQNKAAVSGWKTWVLRGYENSDRVELVRRLK